VINNIEFDHADIFENLGAIQTSFKRFINLIPRNGLLLANGDDPNVAPLIQSPPCPVKQFGLGEHNSVRAFNVKLGPTASVFEIPSFKFHLNLVGELNVRNALAVVGCAKHCGLKNHQIQAAFDTFQGIKRRMEIRGISGGITVVDDFGHHPTAIRETLRALRIKYAGQKLWAIFEPRSNTTRRAVFQRELPDALGLADGVLLSEVARLDQIPVEERLRPEAIIETIAGMGKPAFYEKNADAILHRLVPLLQQRDIVVVFSNGGFDGIHGKLLAQLAA